MMLRDFCTVTNIRQRKLVKSLDDMELGDNLSLRITQAMAYKRDVILDSNDLALLLTIIPDKSSAKACIKTELDRTILWEKGIKSPPIEKEKPKAILIKHR